MDISSTKLQPFVSLSSFLPLGSWHRTFCTPKSFNQKNFKNRGLHKSILFSGGSGCISRPFVLAMHQILHIFLFFSFLFNLIPQEGDLSKERYPQTHYQYFTIYAEPSSYEEELVILSERAGTNLASNISLPEHCSAKNKRQLTSAIQNVFDMA